MVFCIKQREFVGLLGGATVAWPFVALAQNPDRTRRIGVLMSLGENDPVRQAGHPRGHRRAVDLRAMSSAAEAGAGRKPVVRNVGERGLQPA